MGDAKVVFPTCSSYMIISLVSRSVQKCASIYMAKGKIYFNDFYISHLVGQNPLSVLLVWIRMLRHIPTLIETKEVAWMRYETSSTLQKSS